MVSICEGCYQKQRKINELEEEVLSLKARLRYQERTAKEGLFKSSTPSSRKPTKANSSPENCSKQGGAKVGHKGNGRKSLSSHQADREAYLDVDERCPDCGKLMERIGCKDRSVIDYLRGESEKILYKLQMRKCSHCRKVYTAKAKGVFANNAFGNGLLSHIAIEHYLNGRTLGQLESPLGIGYGSLVKSMHTLAERLKDVPERLKDDYRKSPVKHADETSWRNDGQNGYAWGFFTDKISLFRLRKTRSAKVPAEVFGDKSLPGVLIVDRYNGYNKVPCAIQYCYAHLLRNLKDIEKDFPDNAEIKSFVQSLAPLLANAMSLRGLNLKPKAFKRQASLLKQKIVKIVHAEARHPAVQTFQSIFREHEDRMYPWADDPNIPAENNLSERQLRPLVIARKISFGSQSDRGARTREILMTVLNTLKKRCRDIGEVYDRFKSVLDALAEESRRDAYRLLFEPDTS
jgi:transposase